jgi:hypothetical protein
MAASGKLYCSDILPGECPERAVFNVDRMGI